MTFDPNAAAAADSGIFGLPYPADAAEVILIPVPFEATTSYGGGTADGPGAILAASRQVDLFDVDNGEFYERGIHLLPIPSAVRLWNAEARRAAEPVIAAGGVTPRTRPSAARVNALCDRVNDWVRTTTAHWLDRGRLVGIVGGDHCVPFGAIDEIARRERGLSILHVDAHADLRHEFEGFTWSHASIMDNVVRRIPRVSRLVQVGIRDVCREEIDSIKGSRGRIVTYFDRDLARHRFAGRSFAALARTIVGKLSSRVYVSFDIDGLDPVLCPHTGTPVPGGLSFQETVHLLDVVVTSGRRIVGFDLCEVAPGPRGDEWDANVGARVLFKLCGFALRSRPRPRSGAFKIRR